MKLKLRSVGWITLGLLAVAALVSAPANNLVAGNDATNLTAVVDSGPAIAANDVEQNAAFVAKNTNAAPPIAVNHHAPPIAAIATLNATAGNTVNRAGPGHFRTFS